MRVQIPPSALARIKCGHFFNSSMSIKQKQVLKAFIVIALLAVFFIYVPIGEIYRSLRSANLLYFAISVLTGFLGIFLSTASTWILAGKQGISIPLWDFFVFNMAIRFYGFFSPASSIATALRWHKLSAGQKGAEALSAIAVTRAMSIFVAIFMGFFWLISDVQKGTVNLWGIPLFLAVMVAGWLALTRLSPSIANWLHKRSGQIKHKWILRAAFFLSRFFDALGNYSRLPWDTLMLVTIINLANEIQGLVVFILIARALSIPMSINDLGWMRAVTYLAAVTPFTLAGGVGLREVTIVAVMSSQGVSPEVSAAYSFLIYARGAVFSLACGIIELFSLFKPK
jgi:uncharacterized membrane protein YbhN (UPF0104 family)